MRPTWMISGTGKLSFILLHSSTNTIIVLDSCQLQMTPHFLRQRLFIQYGSNTTRVIAYRVFQPPFVLVPTQLMSALRVGYT